ncbi:MAG: histidine kinase [Bacteroidota bacterium]
MEAAISLPVVPWNWPKWRKWTLYFALWSIPALTALSYYHLNLIVTAQPVSWLYGIVSTLPWWYAWAIFTPLIIKLAQRFPVNEESWKVLIPTVYIPAMLAFLGIHALLNLVLFRVTGLHETMNLTLYEVHFTSRMHVNALAFWTVLGFYNAFDYYMRFLKQERQASQLELQLAQANLRALKMQLNPHFLFNTLHSVAALVRKNENGTAVKMLGRLGDFLRLALENQGTQQIKLEEELDFLDRYLEIEKIRFQDRLVVQKDVDPEALGLYVPNLILQPLVENAIHHGIAPHSDGGQIIIRATITHDQLVLDVQDDGPGIEKIETARKGVGLSNSIERMQRLYGDNQQVTLHNVPDGGLLVQLTIPVQHTID